MPKATRKRSESESEEDVKPKVKRQSTSKNEVGSEEPEAAGMEENEQGEQFIKLSETRRATVRSYNKRVLVDIREFYKDKVTGALKPATKGISLTKEQWETLKGAMSGIDAAVADMEKKEK